MLSKNYVDANLSGASVSRFNKRWPISYVRYALAYLSLCFQIHQERRILSTLTSSERRDIGIHATDAETECRRSFFDIPIDRWQQYRSRCSTSD